MSSQLNKSDKAARNGKYKLVGVIAATSLLIGASFGVQAIAESSIYRHAKLYMNSESSGETLFQPAHFRGGGGKHRRGHDRFANLSDAEIESKITRVVKHVSIEIEATPEQEQKITALLSAVAKDMKPLRGQFRAAGEEMHRLLVAETIDREAIERVRTERLAETDRISKELVNAVADVAEVLTPQQRKVLNGRIEQFRSVRKRWHRG